MILASELMGIQVVQKYQQHIIDNIMGKGKDAKKNVKKEAAKTPKEKKAEKRLKIAKKA